MSKPRLKPGLAVGRHLVPPSGPEENGPGASPVGSSELDDDHHHDQDAGLAQGDPRGFDGLVGLATGRIGVHQFRMFSFSDANLLASVALVKRDRSVGGI